MIKYLQQSRKGKSKRPLTSPGVGFVILVLMLTVTSTGNCCAANGDAAEGTTRTTGKTQGDVLHFTDIHFNPFRVKKPEELKDMEAQKWKAKFERDKFDEYVTPGGKKPWYGNETTYNLLVSSLEAMKKFSKKQGPDFIIFTGDFLVHDFHEKYQDTLKTKEGLEEFIKKTVTFVVIMLDEYFPEVPVYVSLGNNDSYKGNYIIEPGGKFLRETMSIISEKWIEEESNRKSFAETYPVGGYFTVVPPDLPNTRIISLNSIFFHSRHEKKYKESKWAFDQLDWLRKKLETAKKNNEKVWLLMHSSPGADYFPSLNGKFEPYWQGYYTAVFLRLIADHSSILEAMYAGHTHMDEFKLVFDCTGRSDKAVAFVKICPAASNVRGTNNPAFLNLIFKENDFSLLDYSVYYLDLSGPKKWKREYTFRQTYGHDKIDAAALQSVYFAGRDDGAARTDYMNYFDVNRRKTLTPVNWKAYWCGIANHREKDYENCLSVQ